MALDKDANRRFQTAEEMLRELKQSPPIVFPEPKKSIVVLPFENLSPDPDQEYFCDGMTEEIITDLSHIHDLLVISRSSAMTFKGTRSTIKEIADKVNVRYVLEGSVRKAGNNLRITAQLIDASNDVHLWAEKYKGALDDIFDIQEKVSRSIVNALKLKLSPQELEQIADRPIDNIKAYECHLRARREMLRTTEEGLKRALQELETGIEIVGDNPLLYMDMGLAYFWYVEYGIKADEESLQKAEELAQKVAQLSPNSWASHYLRGMIIRFRGSALHALEYFKKALAINPDIPEALLMLSGGYSYLAGKVDAAKPMITRLLEIDPLTPLNYHIAGIVYWMDGQLDESLSAMEKMMKMEPDSPYPHVWRLYPMVWKKQYDEVFANIDQFVQQEDIDQAGKGVVEWCLFLKYALQGDRKRALDSVSKEVNRWAWNDPDLPWFWAGLYALINEKEKAMDWLERAADPGFINYPLIAEQDPFLENIRGEPRFKKLMERVKHEWENFEV
jgi:non-specific serine/threonine protein kinase